MKAKKNLTSIMEPLGYLWAYLDHIKIENEDTIKLNLLVELVKQCVIWRKVKKRNSKI